MKKLKIEAMLAVVLIVMFNTIATAQTFKTSRLRVASEKLGLPIPIDSLMPENTYNLTARDGQKIVVRTDAMGEIEHVGIPLFADVMRLLQPSPVYDFLEYALLNWQYKVTPNQLYLSKVIFRKGNWLSLLGGHLDQYECSITNREDKLYVVSWKKEGKEIVSIGIPIDYELLNNDTRRNMELAFVKSLTGMHPTIHRTKHKNVEEESLSIYGTGGLFVLPGKSYLVDILNQNVYYELTTVCETTDTIIKNEPVTLTAEAVLPVVVRSQEHPAETFANLMMCDEMSVPDVMMELDFHLSNYHRQTITLPLSQLKAICRQNGCEFYFACSGVNGDKVGGVMFASNLRKGYNHLFSLKLPQDQLTAETVPTIHADVYLFIPPVDKSKLFGTSPTKKSNAKFKLP